MKHILFLLLIGISANILFAQDIIVKKDGDEIKSKILEITKETIKYKEFDFQDGPVRNIDISEVLKVIYENGKEEYIVSSEDTYNGKYIMLGTGFGMSYGIIGVRFQQRFGKSVGFGYHAGIGYLPGGPTANLSFSVGAKFFPWKSLYINMQFGIVGWESQGYDYQTKEYDDVNQLGISLLTGGDWLFGSKSKFGINFGAGVSFHINGLDYIATPAGDLGFLIRF